LTRREGSDTLSLSLSPREEYGRETDR